MNNKKAITRARVNIKSLAAEAAIIRTEIRKSKDVDIKNGLHYHRISKLRPEARLANLAIGFLRGRKRSQVEITDKPFDFNRLYKKIAGFMGGEWAVKKEEVAQWLIT
jgi:hypothetical protein